MSELTIHTMKSKTDYPANQNMMSFRATPEEAVERMTSRFPWVEVNHVWQHGDEVLIPVEWAHIPMTYRIDAP